MLPDSFFKDLPVQVKEPIQKMSAKNKKQQEISNPGVIISVYCTMTAVREHSASLIIIERNT
jgi:hypothetical protein